MLFFERGEGKDEPSKMSYEMLKSVSWSFVFCFCVDKAPLLLCRSILCIGLCLNKMYGQSYFLMLYSHCPQQHHWCLCMLLLQTRQLSQPTPGHSVSTPVVSSTPAPHLSTTVTPITHHDHPASTSTIAPSPGPLRFTLHRNSVNTSPSQHKVSAGMSGLGAGSAW